MTNPLQLGGKTMMWLILIICGLSLIISATYAVRYGSNHFRMRDIWVFVISIMFGIASIFYWSLYVTSICCLIANLASLASVVRTFRHRHDKRVFEPPIIRTVKQAKILPFSPDKDTPPPPNAA